MSDDERRGAAMLLGVISYCRKALKAEEDEAKKHLSLMTGERLAVSTPDGVTFGYVTMANGKKSLYVYDWDKLASWLESHGFSQAVKTTVDPVWWEANKAAILKRGALIDADGEVCEEVNVMQGEPYMMTKLDDDVAQPLLDQLFKAKRITFDPTKPKAIAAKASPKKGTK